MAGFELSEELVSDFQDMIWDILLALGVAAWNLLVMIWDDPYQWGSLIMLLGIGTTIRWWLMHRG